MQPDQQLDQPSQPGQQFAQLGEQPTQPDQPDQQSAQPSRARVVYKPLVRRSATEEKAGGEVKRAASVQNDPFRRPANEDDDGYDPYSDRPADPAPLFESDPWA